MNEMYEELTVPELKALAEESGIEVPSDARKADIIKALEAGSRIEGKKESPGQQNIYEFQMTSTETATIPQEQFEKIKLHS